MFSAMYTQGLNHIFGNHQIEDPEFTANQTVADGDCEHLTAEERAELHRGLVEGAARHNARLEE